MATEIQLIPVAELSTGQAAAIRNGAIDAVIKLAAPKFHLPPTKLVVRDIRPKLDLDYTYATWMETTGTTANAYETMSSGTLADRRYIGIYGIQDSSEAYNVSKLKISVGNSVKSIWFLENLYPYNGGPRIGFARSVIIIPQNTPYLIQRYVTNTSAGAQIILKGFVVEPYGKVLSP